MSSSFITVLDDLEAFLIDAVPSSWKVLEASKVGKSTGLVLSYNLTGYSNKTQGQQLPIGHMAADIELVLSAEETDLIKAQAKLLPALPRLLDALDTSPDITWENAERQVLPTGETWFSIQIQVLVSTANSWE